MSTTDMQPWTAGPWLAFDLETTGVDVTRDRIVTATLLLISRPDPETRRAEIEAHNWLVDPGIEIPAGATAVHNITTEYAREHGQEASAAVTEITSTLIKHWAPGVPLVVMNAAYDLTLLHHELVRHCHDEGLHGAVGPIDGHTRPVLDPRVLDKAVDPYRKGGRRLDALCRHYGVQLDNAHTSHDDALAACRVVYMIARRYPEIGSVPLDVLHQRQVAWHDEQAVSLQAYFDRKGQQERVDRGWPLRRAS
jgi:DNA polymerase-3 subunit epsilon